MSTTLAFSPCPNDTFLFYAWVHGKVGHTVNPALHDIQFLNKSALEGTYDICKVSIQCVSKLLDNYVLLPSGCALGYGCGPKIVGTERFDIHELQGKKIAIPGKDTTANLLFDLFIDVPVKKHYCTYDQVTALIKSGAVDCGVILHETRFTFHQDGLKEIIDLGHLWESRYRLPLPLGGVVAKRSLGQEQLNNIAITLAQSLDYAWKHPDDTLPYILNHSQEKSLDIVKSHIDLYVTDETRWLSDVGRRSIETLFAASKAKSPKNWLLEVDVPCQLTS